MALDKQQAEENGPVNKSISIIDFANYPFIRRFAGHLNHKHPCAYLYHSGFQSPNQGQKKEAPWEYPVDTGGVFAKQNLIKRWFQERHWASAAVAVLDDLKPSLVIVANAPLEVVRVIQRWSEQRSTPFVYWMQDVHSYAIADALRRKLPVAGALVALYYRRLESQLLRASDRILLIADDHRRVLEDLEVPLDRARVLPNWSTIEDIPDVESETGLKAREQSWRAQHGLVGKRLLMYSGTLGLKHDPSMFVELAKACAADSSIGVVIISSGPDAEQLRVHASEQNLENLYVFPFVDYSMISTTLQAAEILLAILEPEAARFSVPSKILTYACAGRPVVVAMSTDNAAARLIGDVGFGTVTPAGDTDAFVAAVRTLLDKPESAKEFGRRGRKYAEANFTMSVIEERFVAMLGELTTP